MIFLHIASLLGYLGLLMVPYASAGPTGIELGSARRWPTSKDLHTISGKTYGRDSFEKHNDWTEGILDALQEMGMPKSDIGTQFLDAETLSNILVWAKATPKTQWEFQTLLSPMWPAYTGAASTSKLLASQMGDLISALLSVEPTPLQKYVLQKYLKNYRSLKPRQVTRVFWMLPNESQNHIMTQYLGRDAYWNIDQQTVFKRMVGVDFKHETPLPFSKHDIKRFNDLRELDPENAEVIAKIFQYSGTDQLETLLGYPPELYGIREQKHFENHNWRTTTGS